MDSLVVDSCVLLDIFNGDEQWCDWSVQMLGELSKTHRLVINPIIFTEIAFNFDSQELLEDTLRQLNITICNIPLDAAFKVSRIFREYRRRKGTKSSPMPDFYIGAHAESLGASVITRDSNRFKSYYPDVGLYSPSGI